MTNNSSTQGADGAAHDMRALANAFDWCGNWQYVMERVFCVVWIAIMCVFFFWWAIVY